MTYIQVQLSLYYIVQHHFCRGRHPGTSKLLFLTQTFLDVGAYFHLYILGKYPINDELYLHYLPCLDQKLNVLIIWEKSWL